MRKSKVNMCNLEFLTLSKVSKVEDLIVYIIIDVNDFERKLYLSIHILRIQSIFQYLVSSNIQVIRRDNFGRIFKRQSIKLDLKDKLKYRLLSSGLKSSVPAQQSSFILTLIKITFGCLNIITMCCLHILEYLDFLDMNQQHII